MSLINIDHGPHSNTETRLISCGGELNQLETQYVQYVDDQPVARFKVYEPKRIRLRKTPLDHLRQIWA